MSNKDTAMCSGIPTVGSKCSTGTKRNTFVYGHYYSGIGMKDISLVSYCEANFLKKTKY